MEHIRINGGKRIEGETTVHGAKNAVLPILAATILNRGVSVIHNCPNLSDVRMTIEILRYLGCKVSFENSTVTVDSSLLSNDHIPHDMMTKLRSSIIFLGAIVSRQKSAKLSFPGGCEIGIRPIDLHIKALKMLGVDIVESHGYIKCRASKIKPCKIHLDFPSVGATENIMLACTLSDGTTTIVNAAREPEICDLQKFLNNMGAKISGAGSGVIVIEGVKKLCECEHTIIPDRIVASTYLSAALSTGGSVRVKKIVPQHLGAVTSVFEECGAKVICDSDSVFVKSDKRLQNIHLIRTSPYPGFPTDAQSIVLSLLCTADGTSIIKEDIFENRFKHASELMKMGADISIEGNLAIVKGVDRLMGSKVFASDLRSGAALVVAGLGAIGTTQVYNVEYIDRGYENLHGVLKKLGADIERL